MDSVYPQLKAFKKLMPSCDYIKQFFGSKGMLLLIRISFVLEEMIKRGVESSDLNTTHD